MHTSQIATGAPIWVYILLVALVLLGVRRLRTREVPLAVALVPSVAFFVWSIAGVVAFAAHVGLLPAVVAWLTGALVGAASGVLLPDPRGERLPGGQVRQPGTPVPLILYLGVFVVRFACGAWAAVVPAQTMLATTIGIAVGAAVMARLLIGVARWMPLPSTTT